ncbi:hypothetical protein C9374_010741 [Naegleria lovaniensis]|uniref:Uncharacterized protein n=1 Tax=Naegleria lovaniensis TaxID=51637 RepID=A0AA88GF50_NAELO|nr:uncharacterized protein C9374_010741 [Naegleria lovaniensis]KAG2374457.1 hypothetical protein C9374_010741 [Naegleria lovaniensis]
MSHQDSSTSVESSSSSSSTSESHAQPPIPNAREKVKQRMDNEKYLRAHPELKQMIARAVDVILVTKPETRDLHQQICKFFMQENLKDICNNNH